MIINILGAGTWGTTIGSLIAKNNPNYKINIWQRNHSKSQMISSSRLHENLSNHRMPENINFTSNFNNLDGESLTIMLFQHLPYQIFYRVILFQKNQICLCL